jgi:hypothetical protein
VALSLSQKRPLLGFFLLRIREARKTKASNGDKIVLTPAADFALANLLLWHLAVEFILHRFQSKIMLSYRSFPFHEKRD